MKKSLKNTSLTEGVIWKQLLLFALPLLGTSLVQQLYNTVDLWFAGNFIDDKNATASVGASSMLITCIVGFFTGISVGISVIVSHCIGAKNLKKVNKTIHTAMGLSIIGGIVLSAFGISFASTFLTIMNTPKEIFSSSLAYIRIYMFSMIFILTYNATSGVIRALGNSKVPLIIQLIGGLINVLMDFISIRFWHLEIEGIAWATMFSQGISAILSVMYLMFFTKDYKLNLKDLHIHKDVLKDIIKIGIPAGFQSLIITLSNVFIQYKINSFDVNSISAFAIYFKIELVIYLPIVAFGQAMMTFTGQNIGANKPERVKKGIITCIVMGVTYTIISSILLINFGDKAFSIFNDDIEVISCGLRIIKISFPFYFVYVILEIFADTIRGVGNSLSPMIIIMLNICGLRTILLTIFTHINPVLESVAWVYPISWITTAISFIIYYKINSKKLLAPK
ncbi:MAG: MATE family efflux transporter [Oscillospiraceae bacterium]